MDTNHYFDEAPNVESNPKSVFYSFAGFDYVFVTDKGVFSYEKVDKATRILLEVFNEKYSGGEPQYIADVGSGYGVISCVLSRLYPKAQILAVETNERARVLTYINYVNNCQGDNLRVVSPQELTEQDKVDLIVSNPPIRIGKDALHELLGQWSNRLNDTGEMWLVVAKNLGSDSLAGFLEYKLDLEVHRVASKNGFRVFRCVKK